ncbi:unnamed protein product [Adineta steineri]|uniref:Death-associated protein 1 n=1 Tax=Adineta steineri TaxID=433720 RepID=A0A813N7X1_9BILA|nr:unnamed protein product [Adineta steineri]CAF3862708.1 unnamed protein product [Adineta steineri]
MSDQVSSTDTSELKAGHAPALKVGGMRVGAGRPRQTSQGDDKDKNVNNEETSGDSTNARNKEKSAGNDEEVEDEQGTVSNRVAGQMVSGTFVPVEKAFPTEAVKHIHDKPGTHAKHDFHNHAKHDEQRHINQPRKQ